MTAYLYDNNNYYLGTTTLQESPLEPGVFFDQSNSTRISPPEFKENEIPYWNGISWEIKPNYSEKKYYSKINKSEKIFEIGEEFDSNYTDIPFNNVPFEMWDESSNSWIIDEQARNEFELQIRKSEIQKLLLESDYIELPSFLERKGQEIYNQWMTYRANLRLAYHDPNLPLPQAPI